VSAVNAGKDAAFGVFASFRGPRPYIVHRLSFSYTSDHRVDGVLVMPRMGNDDSEGMDRELMLSHAEDAQRGTAEREQE